MALPATTVWELRTTGSDSNGGGFNSARGGTDYSQQNSAQATGTASVSGTTLTATTSIFTSQMVGNLVTDGTSWREITAYTSGTAVTIDSTVSWSAATINVGGAMLTLNKVNAQKVDGNICWIKAGTYTDTVRQDWSSTNSVWDGANPTTLIGYNATRGDNPKGFSNQPKINCATGGVDCFGVGGSGVFAFYIQVDGNDTARDGVAATGTGSSDRGCLLCYINVKRCSRRGVVPNSGQSFLCVRVTDMKAGSNFAIGDNPSADFCVADNNPCVGFGWDNGTNTQLELRNCVSCHNSSDGVMSSNLLAGSAFRGVVAYKNGGNGFGLADGAYNAVVELMNCVAYDNGGYGIKGKNRPQLPNVNYNGYGSNTSGNITGYAAGANDVTLTADPFQSGAATAGTVAACDTVEDVFALFQLNNTAGGGAALRGTGYPSYADIGAVQHQDSGGGGVVNVAYW